MDLESQNASNEDTHATIEAYSVKNNVSNKVQIDTRELDYQIKESEKGENTKKDSTFGRTLKETLILTVWFGFIPFTIWLWMLMFTMGSRGLFENYQTKSKILATAIIFLIALITIIAMPK